MNARTPPPDLADLSDGAKLIVGCAVIAAISCAGVVLLLAAFDILFR